MILLEEDIVGNEAEAQKQMMLKQRVTRRPKNAGTEPAVGAEAW
jgi:hypothetical protein